MPRMIFENLKNELSYLSSICYEDSCNNGWHDNPLEVGTLLCLIHREISEAMEGHRKNLMDDHLPHRPMLEVELADAFIGILDLNGLLKLDVPGAVIEKLEYNRNRADHKPENRSNDQHGKKF